MSGKPEIRKIYQATGTIKEAGTFVDGVREGLTTLYYDPKGIMKETYYRNDLPHGVSREYYRTGELWKEIPYSEGKLEGLAKTYYRSGALQTAFSYKNGKLDGTSRVYYSTGVLQKVGTFKAGKQIGDAGVYHQTGIFKRKGKFFDSAEDRVEVLYEKGTKADGINRPRFVVLWSLMLVFMSGTVFYVYGPYSPFFSREDGAKIRQSVAQISLGEKPVNLPKKIPEGFFRTYYPTGELKTEWNFKNGKLNGIIRKYYKSGKLQSELEYVNGILHGVSRVYRENGRLITQTRYRAGRIVRDQKLAEGSKRVVPVPQSEEDDGGPEGWILEVPQYQSTPDDKERPRYEVPQE